MGNGSDDNRQIVKSDYFNDSFIIIQFCNLNCHKYTQNLTKWEQYNTKEKFLNKWR